MTIVFIYNMASKNKKAAIAQNNPHSPPSRQSEIALKAHIDEIFGQSLSLKLLQFLQNEMQPHHKYFNILEIATMVDQYIDKYLLKMSGPVNKREEEIDDITQTMPLPLEMKLTRKLSENIQNKSSFLLQREETLQGLLDQLKTIFLYYGKTSLNYELINEYVYNQQLNILDNKEKDEDYMEIGEKRIRLDENLKLCIMPLSGQHQTAGKNTKIRQLVFKENLQGNELQSVFAVTKDTVRGVRIKPELIGIAADFDPKGINPQGCWYYYQNQMIKPKRSTINVQFKQQEATAISSAQIKQLRATSATNLDEKFPSHMLNILKVSMGSGMMGMICLDQSFIIEPMQANRSKISQGYIGNLTRDIPSVIQYTQQCKDKYQEILLFHNYNDSQWLILTNKFIYLYQIPAPSENIILTTQNNLHRASSSKLNPLLLLCQRLPKGCIKALILQKSFLALMLEKNMVLIIKLVINNRGIFDHKELNIAENYYKITNKIYNDIQFKCMSFNSTFNNLFLSDFGAYLIRIKFNEDYGDIEEEGITHNRQDGKEIVKELIRNSYGELKVSKNKANNNVIHEVDDEQQDNKSTASYIHVSYLKKDKEIKSNHLLSIYKKQNKSPHTIIIKNQTRQIITLIATNKHYNSLITYQSETYEKKTGSEFQGEKYRQWGNKNKIKLWDIRHMTIYQIIDVSIEVSMLQLRSNGLYAVTTQKGYLGFYPFNEDKKILIGESQQKIFDKQSKEIVEELSDDIVLENNTIYFSSTVSSFNKYNNVKINKTSIYQFQLQKYPHIHELQTIPSQITSIAVNDRLYILENSSKGVEACQLHIYNRMGLKEQMMVFSNKQDVDVTTGKIRGENYNQQYKFLKKVHHQQFHVVLWNNDSLKLIGANQEESLTVIFNSPKMGMIMEGVEKIKTIRNIEVNNRLMIVYCENLTKIRDKAGSTFSINSKNTNAQNSQRKSGARKQKSNTKYHQHIDYSIILINNESDRITYKLQRISQRIKVLHLFNSLIITKEEDPNDSSYDVVRVMDVNQHGDLINKILFSIKFQKNWTKKLQSKDLKDDEFYELNHEKNILLQEIKEFVLKKSIILEESKIAISPNNKMIIILVFKVQTHFMSLSTSKVIKSQVEFMVYVRNISDELLNINYQISKMQVGKKATKHSYQYQTTSGRTESIIGHKTITIDDLNSISNYTEVDMERLCEMMASEEGSKYSGIDITNKILAPKNINTDRKKDIYEILSLKRDEKLFKIFEESANKANAISSFFFQILDFNEDNLTGTVTISNKILKTLGLYTFKIECLKDAENEANLGSEPYRMFMNMEKIALLQVKPQVELQKLKSIKKSSHHLHHQKYQPIQLLDWNKEYKTMIEELWDETYQFIKDFIQKEKDEKAGSKNISLPPINIKKMNTLKIKKAQILKRKLSISERHISPPKLVVNEEAIAEGMTKMFKKWSIGQSIAYQKQQLLNAKNAEMKSVNRYINRVLKSQEDTNERVHQLIESTIRIKEISQQSPESNKSYRKSFENKMQNIIESTEVAQQTSIRSYMNKKHSMKTNTKSTLNRYDSPKLSRSETNKSSLNQQINRFNSDIRATNASKLSMQSNKSYNSSKLLIIQTNAEAKIDLFSFEGKLKKKLEEIQDRSLSEHKPRESLKYYTPQRAAIGHDFRKSAMKSRADTVLEQYSPTNKAKMIKFVAENKLQMARNMTNKTKSSHLITPFNPLLISPDKATASTNTDGKTKSSKIKTPSRIQTQGLYQLNFSLIKPDAGRILKTQQTEATETDPALSTLQKSQQMMKDIFLPEILTNKQKLMLKMKQKKSYIKMIQSHLNDSSLATLRNGQERKKIINKLYEYK